MSEDAGTVDPVPPEAPIEAPPGAFGARLKWERERAGLTVSDVAGRLRLHVNQVRALEQESLGALPEAAYVRGFVRGYARLLGIDPAPVLEDLTAKMSPPTASVVDGIARQRDYSPVREAAREQTSRRLVIFGAVLLLIVLGALGWYATRERPAAPATAKQLSPPEPVVAVTPVPAPVPAEAAVPAASAVPAAAPAAEPQQIDALPPSPTLKLHFSGNSWAEVKDAEGKVLYSQHNAAGAEAVIEGTPPLYVVIGDTTKTAVEVRGEPFDLAPHTRQNVARFTVN
ncbi:MAG TPA: RodZ domain-containing protein [Burkholderiaceae bacterium]|nr:RodZ domain-containing protein [Burkholderiaceae bacterium]